MPWTDFPGRDSFAILILERERACLAAEDSGPEVGLEVALEAMDRALARVSALEHRLRRLSLGGEQSQRQTIGLTPPARPAHAPVPGVATTGRRPVSRAAAQERAARAVLAPHTGNVLPFRPSKQSAATGSNPDRSA